MSAQTPASGAQAFEFSTEDDIVAVNDAPELTVIAAVVGAAGAFASPTRA